MCDSCEECKPNIKHYIPLGRRRRTYDANVPLLGDGRASRILLHCERSSVNTNMNVLGPGNNVENEFVDLIVNLVTKTLNIGYNDSQNFMAVLKVAIGDNIRDLLDDYLDYWVEEYHTNIIDEFKLSEDIKPNYTYANHAKLAPAIDEAKKKFKELQKDLARMGAIGAKENDEKK